MARVLMIYADSLTHDTNFVGDHTYVPWLLMLTTNAYPPWLLGVPPGAPGDVHRTITNVKSSMLWVPPGCPLGAQKPNTVVEKEGAHWQQSWSLINIKRRNAGWVPPRLGPMLGLPSVCDPTIDGFPRFQDCYDDLRGSNIRKLTGQSVSYYASPKTLMSVSCRFLLNMHLHAIPLTGFTNISLCS